ncbi:MAG TPA: cation diffusion facilitator family transporter, partial [Bacteroidota bacterium]|nr:cation diffusion facilitator family transporter [Bacteroidota bacterium]
MAQNLAEREKSRVALSSVVAAVFITALKLVVGLETNSLGILSEAAHSGLDMLAAILTLVAVRIAARPPDKEHPYGHGKVENISAFMETMLLVATCIWIIKEAVERLVTGSAHVEANFWGFGVIVLSIVVDISRSRALRRAAKTYRSQALEADALHFSSDIWSSLTVLAGLVFVSIGYSSLDAVAALAVAVMVLVVSYRLARRTIDALMDRVPERLAEQIEDKIKTVDGVQEVRSLRVR